MLKLQPIQINIPEPCSQDWSEMTPAGEGRFCNLCSRTVIDFTTWSDHDLYKFFEGNNDHVCGRFFAFQLDRSLVIPYQPHTRLYKLAVAMGLTLLFTQIPKSEAQTYSPVITHAPNDTVSVRKKGILSIYGHVADDKHQSMPAAVIKLYQNQLLYATTFTDVDGKYYLDSLQAGAYVLVTSSVGYDSVTTTFAIQDDSIKVDVSFSARILIGAISTGVNRYKKPLIDQDSPDKTILTRDEIEHTPH